MQRTLRKQFDKNKQSTYIHCIYVRWQIHLLTHVRTRGRESDQRCDTDTEGDEDETLV